MSIFENTKNDLKQILPPPVNSFMREINALKAALSQQCDELSELREENRKLLDELRRIREDSKKQSGELSKLREENRKLLDELRGIREDGKKQSGELSELREENRKLLDELRGIREDSKKQSGELSKLREENMKLLDELHGIREDNAKQTGELSSIHNAIPEKPVLWLNEFERGVVRANWGKVTETPDFKEKYLHLISGLDRASVIVINRIIARQKKYLDTEKKELALFTREEQEELRLLSVACAVNTNYYQRILGTGIKRI